MATPLDPRLNAYRDDLADARLGDRVTAARFVEGAAAHVTAGRLSLRRRPAADAPQDSELLHGETVRRFATEDAWAWIQNDRDSYVGYCRVGGLADGPGPGATHAVAVPRTFLYPAPDLKTPPMELLSLESRVAVERTEGKWAACAGGGYVHADHLAALDSFAADPAAVAERFLETPYLWGGKTSVGLDCSGLIQLALQRCGIDCPRDTDMQEDALGRSLDRDAEPPARGDLAFWAGHVGIMLDATRILHANATDMATRIWTLDALADHIERLEGNPIRRIARLDA